MPFLHLLFLYFFCRYLKTSPQYFKERRWTKDFSHPPVPSLVAIVGPSHLQPMLVLLANNRRATRHLVTHARGRGLAMPPHRTPHKWGWWSRHRARHHTGAGEHQSRANVEKGTGHTTTLGLRAMARAGRPATPLHYTVVGERRALSVRLHTINKREKAREKRRRGKKMSL
jgi:hypothetical protein